MHRRPRSVHRAIPAANLVLLLLCSGCLWAPANESTLPDTATPVAFEGNSGIQDDSVTVTAAPDPAGPFQEVLTFPTDAAGDFSGSAVIPIGAWNPICPEGFETFVRVDHPDGLPHVTYDDATLTGTSGEDCVADRLAENDILGALLGCPSAESPIARIVVEQGGGRAGSEVIGDVVIDDPADVLPLGCVTRIVGSLTVDDGVVQDLGLPFLEEVTGNVTIVLERPPGVMVPLELLDLPVLHTIGGSLDFQLPGDTGGNLLSANLGLPALTSLGTDLNVQIEAFNASPSGLAALVTIPGNFSFDGANADASGFGFLPSLLSIGGTVDMQLGNSTTQAFLRTLQTIGGDATIAGGGWLPDDMFRDLVSVGGFLRLTSLSVFSFPDPIAFQSLADVGGTLDVDDIASELEALGSPMLTVGGLRLNDNDWLDDLDVTLAKFSVVSTGPITITDNANLPQCDAEAFVAGLVGYVGTSTISGNQPCP